MDDQSDASVIACITLLFCQTSSSCDGSVQVWSVDDQSEVKTLQVLDKCSDVRQVRNLQLLPKSSLGVETVSQTIRFYHFFPGDEVLSIKTFNNNIIHGIFTL